MRKTVFALFAALMVLMIVWFAWLSPAHIPGYWSGVVLAVAPLAILTVPLWRASRTAYGWTGFVALGYMTHGLTEALANPSDRTLATAEAILAIALLLGVSAALRSRDGH